MSSSKRARRGRYRKNQEAFRKAMKRLPKIAAKVVKAWERSLPVCRDLLKSFGDAVKHLRPLPPSTLRWGIMVSPKWQQFVDGEPVAGADPHHNAGTSTGSQWLGKPPESRETPGGG